MALPSRLNDGRPDPDALLAQAQRESRGRLKVFLGAAPGVGKTYAMLQNAVRAKADGIDVVVGLAETHGRAETEALLSGLEILPRREVEYRGHRLAEFDIDAALRRHPKLLILDELAHTNAADSRHPKRWQDVEELLDSGIDVWTALNVQHLESLADTVTSITGVTVREKVPDKVLRDAADVVLVDITPEELLARLKEGKIYVANMAQRATERFFTTRNLIALRELALRRTADRVDDEMMGYLRRSAIEGPWVSGERLIACIGADAAAQSIVRRTSQLATGLNAAWLAVHVEWPGRVIDPAAAAHVRGALQLAEMLGAESRRISGQDLVAAVLSLARRENATQIVLGNSRRSWRHAFRRRFATDLMRRSEGLDVHVVRGDGQASLRAPAHHRLRFGGLGLDSFVAGLSVACAVALGMALTHVLRLPNLSMIFLAAVLFCAVRRGTRAAIIASVLSFLSYNFFFITPVYTFTVAGPFELLSLLIFLVVAVIAGSLTGRIGDQNRALVANAAMTQSLYEYARKIVGAADIDDVLWAAAAHLNRALGQQVILLVPDGGDLVAHAAWPPDVELDAGEKTAARWAMDKAEPAGWATGTLPRVRFQFRPLETARGVVAVCGFELPVEQDAIEPETERAISAILGQTAIALDRALLARESARAASLEENEKVRDALLASLSHDLRTPLASIAGAASSLRELGTEMTEADRDELLSSIEQETGRLTRFVANLLDMSRIEAGGLKMRQDWVDVADCIRVAVDRSRKVFPDAAIRVSIAADLPFVRADARLLEQVLFNLIDNAQKYGGEGETAVHARREGEEVVVSVTDEGPGIKAKDLERVFEKFYRGGRMDGRKAGTGLGLAISRGLVEAMGGTIVAQSPAARRRGTRLMVRLPAPASAESRGTKP